MTVVAFEPSAAVLRAVPHASALLTAQERTRAARMRRAQDRDDFVAAHALVRLCASKILGAPAESLELHQRCAECDGPHGKPRIAGTHVSLAHSNGMVAAAAGPQAVGVDVERLTGAPPDATLTEFALTPAERRKVRAAADPGLEFLRLWVRKEALVKLGITTIDHLRDIDVCDLPHRYGSLRLLSAAGYGWVGACACPAESRPVRLTTEALVAAGP